MSSFLKAAGKGVAWLLMLQKRTLKKPAFVVILILMPLLAFGLSSVAGSEHGILMVATWWDPADPAADAFAEELIGQNGAMRVFRVESEDTARQMVASGASHFAWIIQPGFEEHLNRYAAGVKDSPAIVVVEKEESAVTGLARERLFSFLFPRLSYALFRAQVLAVGAEPVPDEETIRSLYRADHTDTFEVRFEDVRGQKVKSEKLLTSPARGLLSLLIVEGGIAAAILCAEDEKNGVYHMLPRSRQAPLKAASVFVPMLYLGAAGYLSLALAGLLSGVWYEALLMLLFILAAGGFSLVLLTVLRSPARLGMAALFTAVLTLALTPVFLDFSGVTFLSALLPSYHYLRGASSPDSNLVLLIYAGVSMLFFTVTESVLARLRK